MEPKNTKEWIRPELKIITELNVHENVLATSVTPIGGEKNSYRPIPEK